MSAIGFGISPLFRRSRAGYDADAITYFNTVTTPFSAARKAIINTLVTTLKADGNWTKLDRLWLLATEAQDQALISLVNPASTAMTLVNAPSFVADQGFTGDGATSYINTQYNPSSDGSQFTLNNCSFGIYARSNAGIYNMFHGCDNGTDHVLLAEKNASGNIRFALNNVTFHDTAVTSLGFYVANRTASNATAGLRNSSTIVSDTDVAVAVPNLKAYILCRNSSGTPSSFSGEQYSIFYFGSGSINQSAFYTAIQNYMTSLGSAV